MSYTPDGTKLVTVGLNNAIRIFHTGSDAEPTTIDDCPDSNTTVAATNDFFIVGSEDGTVTKYSLHTNKLDQVLTRCTLPIRDIAISPDGNWAAVASDELVVKVVNTQDMTRVLYLREQSKPAKHLTFDKSGTTLAVSCSDGAVYMYSLSSEEPKLLKKLDGLIKSLETEAEASSKVFWHPDGRAFAIPTATRDFQVVSRIDWEKQRIFKDGHSSDISAAAWSPNGSILVTTSIDRKLLLWDTKDQRVFKSYDDVRATILAMQWHPTKNILSYTNNDGELYIHTDFVPEDHEHLLKKSMQPAPFIHDPLEETNGHARRPVTNGVTNGRRARNYTPDSFDAILDDGIDADGFIEDDDGAGYAEEINDYGKRTNGHLDDLIDLRPIKRQYSPWQPKIHDAFQPSSTPWRGNRRYLCLDLTGIVWTVSQETHHTVTVEFYDREAHRDFHFTDPWLYDKACLNENGALFSCPPRAKEAAMLYYRPHETWTTRADWRIQLPRGEGVVAIALSENYIVCLTSANYVRIYSLFGLPIAVHRQKSSPAVTCAAWRDYVFTVGNGPVVADGRTQLLYSITNVRRDETCQNEDILPLPSDIDLQRVFFSDGGDPCIYDSSGTLLICLHWRTPGQAKWVPLLDTTTLERLRDGKKEESYWPVAVAQEKFHCIILKGGEKYPYFPRPLLSEFDFKMPIALSAGDGEKDADGDEAMGEESGARGLEQSLVLHSTLHALLADLVSNTRASHSQKSELQRRELDIDKTLLQLLAVECREGEERGMKGLEIVGLMKDKGGRMLDAAMKVASRYGREVLRSKIGELAERRLVGLEGDDED